MSTQRLTAVLVGAGHRGLHYSQYALKHPEELKVVAVADPREDRLAQAAAEHGIAPGMCFRSAAELSARSRLADAAINATMDPLHVPTTLPLLAAGYDVLLEKPVATSEAELLALRDAARRHGRTILVCHVLRYAPFYAQVRHLLAEGQLGELLTVETSEYVGYHHMAVGFVRGKWNRKDSGGSSMLLAKCCHDLDLIAWMKSGVAPRRVSSFGSLKYFRPENAPPGSGTRCLLDCRIEATCPYSARKIHVERRRWGFYAWGGFPENGKHLTEEQKLQSLRTDNPIGRCVWRCDNDVVDHQMVLVEFADGTTASHTMVGGAARGSRTLHLVGTKAELFGTMEDGRFLLRRPDPSRATLFSEETVDIQVRGDMHGGGDMRLVADFLRTLRGEERSLSCTCLDDSLHGARIGFAADRSMAEGRVVTLD